MAARLVAMSALDSVLLSVSRVVPNLQIILQKYTYPALHFP